MKTKPTNKIIIPCVAVLAAALCAGIFVYTNTRSKGQIANVYKDGKLVYSVDLGSAKEPHTEDIGGNTVLIKNGSVMMKKAECPDKLCVKQGEIHNKGEAIICLPNKVIIEIEGDLKDIDAVSK
jgi:hypothetical protein